MTTLDYLDIRCGDDLDRFARDARPLEVLGQDIYHWLITDPGALVRYPSWGFGIDSHLSKPLSPTLEKDVENGIRGAFADRVSDAKCSLTKIDAESFRIDVLVEADSEFLTLALLRTPSGIVRVA